MKKITIIGAPGTGKSTVAVKVAEILNLPVFHLDCYYWNPGWQEKSFAEFKEIYDRLIDQPEWIIEGCSTKTIPERIAAADTIVYLIASRPTCLWRIARRIFSRKQIGAPIACRPRITCKFLKYTWCWRKRYEPMIMELLQRSQCDKRVFVIRNTQELEQFLDLCKTNV